MITKYNFNEFLLEGTRYFTTVKTELEYLKENYNDYDVYVNRYPYTVMMSIWGNELSYESTVLLDTIKEFGILSHSEFVTSDDFLTLFSENANNEEIKTLLEDLLFTIEYDE